MKRIRISVLPLFLLVSAGIYAQDKGTETLFAQEELKLIAADFSFTEGCSADKAGNVFFTDQPGDKIWRFGTDGVLSVFLERSGRANGTYFDRKGNLMTCADEKGELRKVSPDGRVKVILAGYEGKQFNGPNDLWINRKGDIYFTDPYYQRDYWTRTSPDLKENNVYCLPKGSSRARMVADSLIKPNGIVGTPDGKYLYVADINAGLTYRYSIEENGNLSHKVLLIKRGSDGMTLDEKGNIYLTSRGGVYIYNREGLQIGQIKVPEDPSNVCFAGKEKNQLFITARKSIYSLVMKVRGVE